MVVQIMQNTANDEMLKLAMIETKESLDKLDEIMSTPGC
jgi:4-hydroxy-2-oxoheptanedioate aldolase